jgi:hypothetical protein
MHLAIKLLIASICSLLLAFFRPLTISYTETETDSVDLFDDVSVPDQPVDFPFVLSNYENQSTITKSSKESVSDLTFGPMRNGSFLIDHYSYPKVNFSSKKLNKLINDSIHQIINTFVNNSYAFYLEQGYDSLQFYGEETFGVLNVNYSITENSTKYFSCIFYLTETYGGGNNWIPSATTLNIDKRKRKAIQPERIKGLLPNLAEINKKIDTYFNTFEGDLSARLNQDDLDYANWLIAKDSLFLVAPIHPRNGSHADYQVYKIPIKKMGK